MIEEVREVNFSTTVLKETKPVIVLFKSQWCSNCKKVLAVIEEIASTYLEKIKVVTVDITDNHKLAIRFEVLSIPTILIFKGETLKARLSGATSKEAVLDSLGDF